MCLIVYLGTTRILTISDTSDGQLTAAISPWTPPPLQRGFSHIYRLGTKSAGGELGCSCPLHEHVEWTDAGAVVAQVPDSEISPCPFEVLRTLCDQATRDGGLATIVCDDSGGAEQECTEEDYGDSFFIRLSMIARGNLLFADVYGGFPWRVMHVVR